MWSTSLRKDSQAVVETTEAPNLVESLEGFDENLLTDFAQLLEEVYI